MRQRIDDGSGRYADPNGTLEEKFLHYFYAHRASEEANRGLLLKMAAEREEHGKQIEELRAQLRRANRRMSDEIQLPPFQSIKVVGALKIAKVETPQPGAWHLSFEDTRFAPRTTPANNRPLPQSGWYYVVYDNGYESYSPPDEFERGYVPISINGNIVAVPWPPRSEIQQAQAEALKA